MECRIELNSADQGNALSWLVVALDGGNEMFSVNANSDKDVECLYIFCRVYWYKTAMAIVYEEVTS